jgi:hypothetical protein
MLPKLYLETTIVSYRIARPSRDLITAAHQQITQDWWENQRQNFELFASELVLQEAQMGDPQAVQRRLDVMEGLALLQLTDNATDLAQALLKAGAVPMKAVGDALHIAIATVHGMDYLLTWNMKHIANATVRNVIGAVCRAQGYEMPTICTPEELQDEEA